jgi:hypothetical protein
MVTLTNPVTPQNIVDRFKDLVTDVANTGIVYGTDSKPFVEMPDATYAGTTAGATVTATGATIGSTGNAITASTIKTVLETETALYTNIRLQRAIKNLLGSGVIFDATNVAHMATSDRQTLGAINSASVDATQTISSSNLETYFGNLATEYTTLRSNTVTTTIDVCHTSCHSSCHSSRGRR